jgi:hypothetical protein
MKGYGSRRSWPELRYSIIYPEGLKRIAKTLSIVAGKRAEISTRNFQNMKLEM